jgi:DNA-nicking Smr family endonuclease
MEQDVVHPGAPKTVPAEDEDRIFLEAVSGVIPLSPSAKKTVMPVPDPRRRPAHPPPDDELETMAHLYDLISGTAELDITFSDEFIEGAVPGFDRKLMLRLKRGEFALQDHVDLHGLTKQEAEVSVQRFLTQSYHRGLRCVLVITGRGLNSENQIPILKERLPVWLRQGPARKIVLAFSTARPYDGGMGAIYVLLRRRRNPSPVP